MKEAKALYDLGMAIIWLKPNSKMPVESGWTSGPRTDFDILKRSFKPGYNMGVRLGDVSYFEPGCLAVIDCDVKSEDKKDLIEMRKALNELFPGWITSPIVQSGRGNGSMHIYMLVPNGVTGKKLLSSANKVAVYMPSVAASAKDKAALTPEQIEAGMRSRNAWEIDLMANGRQVVLPPSIHPDSMKRYEWSGKMSKQSFIHKIQFVGQDTLDRWFAMSAPKSEAPKVELKNVDVNTLGSSLVSTLRVSQSMKDSLQNGAGVEDRSAFLLKASLAMLGAGHTEKEVLEVLTDRESYIGQAAYEHAKTNDRAVAAKWIQKYTLKKAVATITEERNFGDLASFEEIPAEEFQKMADEATSWTDLLDCYGDGANRGRPKVTLQNLVYSLEKGLEGLVMRNLVRYRDELKADTPWGRTKGQLLEDTDVSHLILWLEKIVRFPKVPENLLFHALTIMADRNSYDPLRVYLDSLNWDKVPRLNTWLKDYAGAEGDDTYLAAIGRKFLLAMVKRAYEPGCKFDHVLIIEGLQGIGKSSLARSLAGGFFTDADIKLGSKDTIQLLQGSWIVEMGELAAMKKTEVEELKKFITQTHDDIRLPYARLVKSFPRRFCLIGTTNKEDYFKDDTGNRRYWPFRSNGTILHEEIKQVRDLLFAEACYLYQFSEETLWLDTDELKEIATGEQLKRQVEDPIIEDVERVVIDLDQFDGFTAREVWDRINPLSQKTPEIWELTRIGAALRKLGFVMKRQRSGPGVRQKLFVYDL